MPRKHSHRWREGDGEVISTITDQRHQLAELIHASDVTAEFVVPFFVLQAIA